MYTSLFVSKAVGSHDPCRLLGWSARRPVDVRLARPVSIDMVGNAAISHEASYSSLGTPGEA